MSVYKFAEADVVAACRAQGAGVVGLPASYDAARVLWAFTGCESSFGQNCAPRHEPAYDVGGVYAKNSRLAELLDRFGSLAACSYGPMQVMLLNCPDGSTPNDFTDLSKGIAAGVFALNDLLRRFAPPTLDLIGRAYNGGHPSTLNAGAIAYGRRLVGYYNAPMPA